MSRMLFVCDKRHETIVHTESKCPLCKVKAELVAAKDTIDTLEEEKGPTRPEAFMTRIR